MVNGMKLALVLGAVIGVVGCAADADPEASADSEDNAADSSQDALTASTCDQYGTVDVNNKAYVVQNDRWGADTKQCIKVTGTSFQVTESQHNKPLAGPPASYASIFKGCHWGNCTNGSGMPKQVSAISSMRSNWHVVAPNSGAYDVAYDIWFNSKPESPGQNDGAELMIWLDKRDAVQPVGSKIASNVSIAGKHWDVWFGNIGWNVISYVQTPLAGTDYAVSNFDLKAFMNDARGRGKIDSRWYLTSIQAGFEIWRGAAGLTTKSFSATVR